MHKRYPAKTDKTDRDKKPKMQRDKNITKNQFLCKGMVDLYKAMH